MVGLINQDVVDMLKEAKKTEVLCNKVFVSVMAASQR